MIVKFSHSWYLQEKLWIICQDKLLSQNGFKNPLYTNFHDRMFTILKIVKKLCFGWWVTSFLLEPESFIFLSEPTLIYRFLLDTNVPEIPLFYQSEIYIDQIDYNMHTKTLFWLNQNEIKYFSVGEKLILNLGVDAMPYSFVIDFYTNYLYWTDIRTDSINFININDPTMKGIVFRQEGCRPRKLAIFPEKG